MRLVLQSCEICSISKLSKEFDNRIFADVLIVVLHNFCNYWNHVYTKIIHYTYLVNLIEVTCILNLNYQGLKCNSLACITNLSPRFE